jgi:hypothetical protein
LEIVLVLVVVLVLDSVGFRTSKEPDFLATILFRWFNGEISWNREDEDDEEHENEFSTSEFELIKFNQQPSPDRLVHSFARLGVPLREANLI